ncbi:MAG TPA: MFS transporter [Baekduia sp.]
MRIRSTAAARLTRLFEQVLGAEVPRGPAAIFALTALVGSTGNGVFAVSAALFLTRAVDLSVREASVALSLSAAVSIGATALLGRFADRCSPRAAMVALCGLRAAVYALLAVVGGFTLLVVALSLTATSDLLNKPIKQTLMKTTLPEEERRESFALQRSIINVAFGLGALIAGVAVSLDSPGVLRSLVILNAVLFLPMMVLYRRLPEPPRAAVEAATENGVRRRGADPVPSPWRDARYLVFSACSGTLMLHYVVLSFALPLWLAAHTAAPLALVGATWIVNTALTAIAQARWSRWIVGLTRGANAFVVAGGALALGCGALYAASCGGAVAASALILAAGVLLSVAEIIHTTAEFEVSVALAPEAAQTAYFSVTGAAAALSQLVGPLLVGALVLPDPAVGWGVLAAIVLGAGCLVRATIRPAAVVPAGGGLVPAEGR